MTAGTWIGGTAGSESDWFTAANWFGGEVPNSATDVRIPASGTGQPVITGETTAVCRNLTISEAAIVEISAGTHLTVNGSLLNNGTLKIESSGVSSSGSMIVYGSSSGTGMTTYDRDMPASLYRYVSSPVSSATLPSEEQFWLWEETLGQWIETASCESGRGYTMRADGGTVSFTGSVVTSAEQTGSAPYTSEEQHYENERGVWGGGGWNLLGNPFTSALNVSLFLSENPGDFDPSYQAVYIYDGSDFYFIAEEVSGYEGLGSFVTRDIQAGQGFFVLANYEGVVFNFTSGMQTHNRSAPMTKSVRTDDTPWPGVILTAKQGDIMKSTQVIYNDGMTPGLDPGYDVGLFSTDNGISIYTSLVLNDDGINFARQVLPLSGADTIMIPLGVDTEKGGEVTFSASAVPAGSRRYWLYDSLSGISTDLTKESYTVPLPGKTYGPGRFWLKSAESVTAINTPGDDGSVVRIWASDDRVIIKGNVGAKANCEVFDLHGLKVADSVLQDGELNFVVMPVGSKGVFVVRLTDGERIYIRKIVII